MLEFLFGVSVALNVVSLGLAFIWLKYSEFGRKINEKKEDEYDIKSIEDLFK